MMSSMDAEAEMEGLFGGEDQEQEQEATQSLSQEEREAGGANLDVTGAAGDGTKKRTVIRAPQPKLDGDRLMGPRGINTLESVFQDFKPKGKGREFDDLDRVMKRMEHWAHRLYPKLPFDSTLDIIANRLGKKKVVQTHVKKIRLGMVQNIAAGDAAAAAAAEEEEAEEVARYGEQPQPPKEVPDLFSTLVGQDRQPLIAPPVVTSSGLTEEQKERIKRNKELAAQKKKERERREALERELEGEMDDLEDNEEVEREMLTSQNASEWGEQATRNKVKANVLKTVRELHQQNKNKLLDSDSDGEVVLNKANENVTKLNSVNKDELGALSSVQKKQIIDSDSDGATEDAIVETRTKKAFIDSDSEEETDNKKMDSKTDTINDHEKSKESDSIIKDNDHPTVLDNVNKELTLDQMMDEMEEMEEMDEQS